MIFQHSGPMIQEPCNGYIKEVISQQQNSEGRYKDIFFIEVKRDIMTNSDWGCDWHPNIQGSNNIANVIVPVIKLRMNW